ncbi:hypothetical protein PIROE2DRAFT_11900 [Piromyces sp. E2]|nr:hypothetical protein PIROE2DRAFT_11900 [Piromyces sp. E2]|eukprot:OUM61935.1 hypothetical protein PIROE2DRAFT_11900 [Piromyces sp. E2]
MCSINTFLYSYRDSKDSPFPELTNDSAKEALEMLRTMKNDISSDDPSYVVTALPGKNEGISGATIIGNNVGIKKYSNDELKKNATITAFRYITSKEVQRKFVIENNIFSSILSIYDEEEVCNKVKCELFKSIQPIGRPTSKTNDYKTYSEEIRNYILENFLYGHETAEKVLQQVEDLTKTYYITINDFSVLIFSFIIMFISIVILISLILLLTRKFKPYFRTLSSDFWFLIIVGFILIIFFGFPEIGKKNETKCHFQFIMISLGLTLNLIPILHRLIINMPFHYKYTALFSNNKYTFFFIFLFFDLIMCTLFYLTPYSIEYKNIKDGKNFEICKLKNVYGILIEKFSFTIKFLILLAIIFLCYLEWNVKKTNCDIHVLVLVLYTDILILISMIVYNYIKIENYKMYKLHFIISECLCIFYVIINYSLLIGIRIIRGILKKNNDDLMFIKKINKNFVETNITKLECTINQNIISTEYLTTKQVSVISDSDSSHKVNSNYYTSAMEIK